MALPRDGKDADQKTGDPRYSLPRGLSSGRAGILSNNGCPKKEGLVSEPWSKLPG